MLFRATDGETEKQKDSQTDRLRGTLTDVIPYWFYKEGANFTDFNLSYAWLIKQNFPRTATEICRRVHFNCACISGVLYKASIKTIPFAT